MLDEPIVSRPVSIPLFVHFPRGLRSKIYFWESALLVSGSFFYISDYQKFIILLARHYPLNNFIDRLTSTVFDKYIGTYHDGRRFKIELMQQPLNYPNSFTLPLSIRLLIATLFSFFFFLNRTIVKHRVSRNWKCLGLRDTIAIIITWSLMQSLARIVRLDWKH